MAIYKKQNNSLTPNAGLGVIDNILNKFSKHAVSNEAVSTEFEKINEDLTDNSKKFKFGYQNGKYGYYKQEGGADTFFPFLDTPSQLEWEDVSSEFGAIVNKSIGSAGATVNYDFSDVTGVRMIINYSDVGTADMSVTLWDYGTYYTPTISGERRQIIYSANSLWVGGTSTNARVITHKVYVTRSKIQDSNIPTS